MVGGCWNLHLDDRALLRRIILKRCIYRGRFKPVGSGTGEAFPLAALLHRRGAAVLPRSSSADWQRVCSGSVLAMSSRN